MPRYISARNNKENHKARAIQRREAFLKWIKINYHVNGYNHNNAIGYRVTSYMVIVK